MFKIGAMLSAATALSGFILESQPNASPGFTKTLTQINITATQASENEALTDSIDALLARISARRNTPTPVPRVPT